MTLTVTVTHDPANGDLDVELVDGGNPLCPVVTSSTVAGLAVEKVMATGPGFRCIHVFGHTGVERNDYVIDMTIN